MKLIEFVKGKMLYLFLLVIITATIIIFLLPYNVDLVIMIYIALLPIIIYILCTGCT